MLVAGFDLGMRKAAMSVFDSKTGEVKTQAWVEISKPMTDRSLEIWTVVRAIEATGQLDKIEHAVVEEPLVGRGVRASLAVAQTVGGFLHALGERSVPTTLVPVATWKKEVLGNGHASKDDVRRWCSEYLDENPRTQDECDALAIGRYAVLLARRADVLRHTG